MKADGTGRCAVRIMARGVGTTERVRVQPKLLSVEPPVTTKALQTRERGSDGPELYEVSAETANDDVGLMQLGGDRRKKLSKASSLGRVPGPLESLPPSTSFISLKRNIRAQVIFFFLSSGCVLPWRVAFASRDLCPNQRCRFLLPGQ